jgi:hypothetical protein
MTCALDAGLASQAPSDVATLDGAAVGRQRDGRGDFLLAAHAAFRAGRGLNRSSLAQVEVAGEAVEAGGELAAVVVGPAGGELVEDVVLALAGAGRIRRVRGRLGRPMGLGPD